MRLFKEKINYNDKDSNQSGFTIVELMIATVVFSLVLLVCSYAIIHVGRMYYKGMVMSRTQDVSKKIVDDVVETIKFHGTGTFISDEGCYIIGSIRYKYSNDRVESDSNFGLLKDSMSSCDQPPAGKEEFVGKNMRLANFQIYFDSNSQVWAVDVTVSYGEDDDFEDPSHMTCKGGGPSSQFCAVSTYSTQVLGRMQ